MTLGLAINTKMNAELLTDRVAFVTAAGSGIGRAGAIAMAQCGAHVIVTDIDGKLAVDVATGIVSQGHKATSMQLDVTNDDALKTAIDSTIARFGRLDIFHSHAGIRSKVRLNKSPRKGWTRHGL